jgi:hypothetical protein
VKLVGRNNLWESCPREVDFSPNALTRFEFVRWQDLNQSCFNHTAKDEQHPARLHLRCPGRNDYLAHTGSKASILPRAARKDTKLLVAVLLPIVIDSFSARHNIALKCSILQKTAKISPSLDGHSGQATSGSTAEGDRGTSMRSGNSVRKFAMKGLPSMAKS